MSDMVPDRYLQSRTAYRSMGTGGHGREIGCGFLYHARPLPDREIVFDKYGALLLLKGSGTYIDYNGDRQALRPGCFVQRLPGRPHRTPISQKGEWLECFIVFGTPLYEALVDLGCIDCDRPVLQPGIDLSIISRFDSILNDLLIAAEAELPLLLARMQTLLAAIYEMDRRGRKHDSLDLIVQESMERLGNDLGDKLDLATLAQTYGLSYERFRKLFRERTGIPPGEYRIRRRIERAKALIAQTRWSVQQVADELGYPDAFTFSKQFKKVAGISPREFRRST